MVYTYVIILRNYLGRFLAQYKLAASLQRVAILTNFYDKFAEDMVLEKTANMASY
jgi:hypothetical protein